MDADDLDAGTLNRLMRVTRGDEQLLRTTIAVSAAAFGTTQQAAAERMLAAVLEQQHNALEALSDDDLPQQVIDLAAVAGRETGEPITAIKRHATGYLIVTAGNPIALQDFFAALGHSASALNPNHCLLEINDGP